MKLWSLRRADERDLPAVGRPDRIAVRAPDADVGLEALVDVADARRRLRGRHAVDLAVLRVRDVAAVGREHAVLSFGQPPRGAAGGLRRPDGALDAVRIRFGARHPAVAVQAVAARERDRRPVIRNRQLRRVDAVVFHEGGDADRAEARRRRREDVAQPLVVRDPGDAVRLLRGDQFQRVAGAHELRHASACAAWPLPAAGACRRAAGRRRA